MTTGLFGLQAQYRKLNEFRRKTQRMANIMSMPQFLTPGEAKTQYGWDISPDRILKVTGLTPGKTAEKGSIAASWAEVGLNVPTEIVPDKENPDINWEITPTGIVQLDKAYKGTGKAYTWADLEQQKQDYENYQTKLELLKQKGYYNAEGNTYQAEKALADKIITPEEADLLFGTGWQEAVTQAPEVVPEAAPPTGAWAYDYDKGEFVEVAPEVVAGREAYYKAHPGVGPEGTPGAIAPQQFENLARDVFGAIYAETDIEAGFQMANQNPEQFRADLVDIGKNEKTVAFLKALGATDADIEQFFAPTPAPAPTPAKPISMGAMAGAMGKQPQQLTVPMSSEDIERMIKGEAPIPPSPDIEAQKNLWNTLYGALKKGWHSTTQPINKILSMLPIETTQVSAAGITELSPEQIAKAKQFRQTFAQNYTKGKAEFDDWVKKHPEIELPADIIEFQEQTGKLPLLEQIGEYVKNPRAAAYIFVAAAPPTLAALGAFTGVTALTGSPILGMAASFATFAPMQIEDVAQDLISAGAPEDKAYQLAVPVGALIASLDVVGEIPLLRALSPALKPFEKGLQKQLVNRTVLTMLKRGLTTFTAEEFTETLTEVAQQVIQDYTVSFFDKTRDPFGNINQTAVQTLIAVTPFALFGGAVSMSTLRGGKPAKLTDLYQEKLIENKVAGLEDTEAKAQALNEIAKLPEGEAAIKKAYDEIVATGKALAKGEAGFVEIPGGKAKEPWQMTKAEYVKPPYTSPAMHKYGVQKALSEGKPVPAEVLKDYPELAKAIPKAEPGMPEAGLQPSMLPGEIAAKEVRPEGKGRVTQISMDEALKLEQAKIVEQPATKVGQSITSARNEALQVIKDTITESPEDAALVGSRIQSSLDAINHELGLRKIPYHGRVKSQFSGYTSKQLDEMAKTYDSFLSKTIPSTEGIKPPAVEAPLVKEQPPVEPVEELPTVEPSVKAQEIPLSVLGVTSLTREEIDMTVQLFTDSLQSKELANQRAATLELRKRVLARRASNASARAQELIVEGKTPGNAVKQAESEFMSGKLPTVDSQFMIEFSNEMRTTLEAKVYDYWTNVEPNWLELMSGIDALHHALRTGDIPRKIGTGSKAFPSGGSAYLRLERVFGGESKVLQALNQGKPFEDVVEGVFRVPGPPVQLDQDMLDYLRSLSTIPRLTETGQEMAIDEQLRQMGFPNMIGTPWIPQSMEDLRTVTSKEYALRKLELDRQLAEGKINKDTHGIEMSLAKDKAYPVPLVPKYELPIEDAINQMPLMPRPAMDNVIRALKEIGMLPVDIGNFLRANKASFDFSFWRQQAPLIASHPISFVQANIEAWKALWSQKSTEASWERITRDPLYQIYEECERNGGDFLRPIVLLKGTAQYKGTEEYGFYKGVKRLLPRLTAKLPWVKLSARAFETGTNVHNWLIFKSYYKAMLKLSEMYASGQKTLKSGESFSITKEMVDFSKSLANFTARGSLGKFAVTAPELSGLFFAPRAAIGRILSVKDLINPNPRVRLEAWKNTSTFVGTFGGMILLGAMMGWWGVETDSRSAEYMSIRIGNTRIDPWGGYRQFLVFFTRAITKTGVSSVTGAEYKTDPLDLMQNFIRGKASPLASFFLDAWKGKNFVGEEFDVKNKKQWVERVAPFAVWDIYEAYQDDPIHALQSAIPAVLGAGVQTYTGDWNENAMKLGLPKYPDNLPYGITQPPYDVKDFWSDTASQFKGVDPATLTEKKGFPPRIKAIAEANQILEQTKDMPRVKLTSIPADPAKGLTFSDYYSQWRKREELVASGDKAVWVKKELQPDGSYKETTFKGDKALIEYDKYELTKNARLGNMTQTQFALLTRYHMLTGEEQKQFIKDNPGIDIDPYDEWLKSHPEENAKLAVWGQADILSSEAYAKASKLAKDLDIPDNALPDFGVPEDEETRKAYFEYHDIVDKFGYGSPEAHLLLLKNEKLHKFESPGWTNVIKVEDVGRPMGFVEKPILVPAWDGKPIPALEIEVKNRVLNDERKALTNDRDIKAWEAQNPSWVADKARIDAYKAQFAFDNTIADKKIVEDYVNFDKTPSATSLEGKLFRLEHPDFDKVWSEVAGWESLTDPTIPGYVKNIDALKLKIANKPQDDILSNILSDDDKLAYKLKLENKEYTLNTFRITALEDGMSKADADVEADFKYETLYYKSLTDEDKQSYFFDPENKEYALDTFRREAKAKDIPEGKIEAYALKEYKDKYFNTLNKTQQDEYLANDTGYHIERITETGTKAGVPTNFMSTYVKYELTPTEGQARERLLQGDQKYYNDVYLGILGGKPIDFTKVATERFETTFNTEYADAPDPELYRYLNPWFDEEGVSLGKWKPVFVKSVLARQLTIANKELDEEYTRKITPADKQQFQIEHPDWVISKIKIKGLNQGVPDNYIDNYVEYEAIPSAGWSQERYMITNRDYYTKVYKTILANKPMDFRNVPSEEVEYQYNVWLDLRGKAKFSWYKRHTALRRWLERRSKLRPSGATDYPEDEVT